MAYISDIRGKNLLNDLDIQIRDELKNRNINCYLEFRVFDEPDEDALLWEKGGCVFKIL